MSDKPSPLRPAYQIGICLVLIIVIRVYYAWIEAQTYWLYPRIADNPWSSGAVFLGLVPIVSLMAALAANRYFSPALTIPFAAVGGGTAGLIVNSIPGALLGAAIGTVVYSRALRRWISGALSILVKFGFPALLWGACVGSVATNLFVRASDRAFLLQLGLLILFLVGLSALLVGAVRSLHQHRGTLIQAIVGCILAGGLGLAIGPMANTYYRIYALSQVGDVSWNPIPRFNGFGRSIWTIHGVYLDGRTTDAHLRLLQGLPSITMVYVQDADLSDEAVAEVLGNLPELQLLEIKNVAISDKALASLRAATQLYQLRLSGAKVTDATFSNLASNPILQVVDINGVTLKGQGLRDLAGSGRLRYLSIENAPLTDDHLAGLNGLQGLTTLHLGGTKITGSGLKHLAKLPSLNSLMLINSPVDDRYLADLNPTAFRFLDLDGVQMSDSGANALAAMTSLRGLSLRRANLTDTQLQILSKLPPTTQLALDGRRLTPTGTNNLAAEDITILVDDASITEDDVKRLIDIGYDVRLTDCQFDEASIAKLATHKTDPHVVILVQEDATQMSERLKGGSVQVLRYWPD